MGYGGSSASERVMLKVRGVTLFVQRHLSSSSLSRTALNDFHMRHKGRMVEFAGFQLPVQYGRVGIIESSLHVRENAGLFDVSHMLQLEVTGPRALELYESLTVADLQGLGDGQGMLSTYLNDNGGIHDDVIINRINAEQLYVVSNAACSGKIRQYLQHHSKPFGADVSISVLDKSLIALQGPRAAAVLSSGLPNGDAILADLFFMESTKVEKLFGQEAEASDELGCIRITRCGYTGEDGFEISLPNAIVDQVAQKMVEQSDGVVKPTGLGARDVLRLEAGMCLYGNDLDERTTPVEASLVWTIGKARREPDRRPPFPGFQRIMDQLNRKVPFNRRVGLRFPAGAQAKRGVVVQNDEGESIGLVTSGCYSPTLNCNISMAYLPSKFVKRGTKVHMPLRKRLVEAEVVQLPFVENRFVRRS